MTKIKTATIAIMTLLLLGSFAITRNIKSDAFGEEIGQAAINPTPLSQNPVTDEEAHLTLILDSPPSSANSGDIITFTGTLSNGAGGISGKTVLIKDNDPYGVDNILGAALTGNNGEFVIIWTAKRTDPRDNTVEVYAMFKDSWYLVAKSSEYVIIITEGAAK